MESRQAMIEFASLLAVGASALMDLARDIAPAENAAIIKELLSEVESIAARLREIGNEITKA